MDSAVVVALISFAGLVFNILYTNRAQKKRKKTDDERNIEDGLQCLLRAEIIRAHDKYTGRGYCPIYAKESLTRAYTAYHSLGGNDIATALYNECLSLPEQSREEICENDRLEEKAD